MVNAKPGPRPRERCYAVGEGHRSHRRPAALRPASPPSSATLGPSSGTPLTTQPKVHRGNDHLTTATQPLQARRRAPGQAGEEECDE
ncbi:hypothetical protein NDU88_009794 [Pleurodeles waltl]|uniref:Uncharacterized protein n=1 Tax=Pleurodeles waltl TaxID=8319 RepID=A0AAV7QW23_PLEWA|nr:hypothetical protein NDU88_009794 [Pleurodeles waltl]